MHYGVATPRNWLALSEMERQTRGEIDADLCRIDDTYYVRGCLEIPVLDSAENLVLGVWSSVSEVSFKRILDLWNATDLDREPPLFGWFDTWINGYPEPVEIKCHVHLRAGGLRPWIELEPTNYPLSVEQREGITLDRVKAIAANSHLH